jgi:mannose PTS system EIIA component
VIGVIIAAHARLAESLLATARSVVPNATKVLAVEITDADSAAAYDQRLRRAVEEVRCDGGVLVITDMFGGTPSNVGLTLHKAGEIEVLTGANLAMTIKALQLSTKAIDLAQAARQVRETGQRSIAVASEVLGATAPAQTNGSHASPRAQTQAEGEPW